METREQMDVLARLAIGVVPKAMIALVLLGKKPSVELDLFIHSPSPDTIQSELERIELVVLPVYGKKTNERHTGTFAISLERNLATILAEVANIQEQNPGKSTRDLCHSLYGALMGYPLSAIDGFISNRMLSEESQLYPETVKGNMLLVFKLSIDHWEQEMETLIAWERALQRAAPKILDELYSVIVR